MSAHEPPMAATGSSGPRSYTYGGSTVSRASTPKAHGTDVDTSEDDATVHLLKNTLNMRIKTKFMNVNCRTVLLHCCIPRETIIHRSSMTCVIRVYGSRFWRRRIMIQCTKLDRPRWAGPVRWWLQRPWLLAGLWLRRNNGTVLPNAAHKWPWLCGLPNS
jgi:hypothetical protein